MHISTFAALIYFLSCLVRLLILEVSGIMSGTEFTDPVSLQVSCLLMFVISYAVAAICYLLRHIWWNI